MLHKGSYLALMILLGKSASVKVIWQGVGGVSYKDGSIEDPVPTGNPVSMHVRVQFGMIFGN
jgi:hypothetical protein